MTVTKTNLYLSSCKQAMYRPIRIDADVQIYSNYHQLERVDNSWFILPSTGQTGEN